MQTGKPTGVRWSVFSLACATSALLYLHRYAFAFIKPNLAEEWNLNATELGGLDSGFSVFYTVFQFPLAIAADGLGVHLVLSLLILIWCCGMGLTALAPTAGWMWSAQAVLGTGQSAVYACLSRVARVWFPPGIRTTLAGAVGVLAGRLGALGASLIFGWILLGVFELRWQTATWVITSAGVVLFVAFTMYYRNSPRVHPAVNPAEADLIEGPVSATAVPKVPASERTGIRQLFRGTSRRSIVNLCCLCGQTLLSTFADNIYSNWIPLFLAQVHHLKFKEMGIYSALPLLGGAIAGLIGGSLNDYCIALSGNRRWSRVAVALTGKGLAAILMFAALFSYDRPYAFCVFLFFVKLFGDWSLATSWGVVTDIGGKATASVFAFNNSVASIGAIVAPLVFGFAADHFGWRMVFVIVGVTYALCALSWLTIDCTIPVSGEAVGEKEVQPQNPRENSR